MDDKLHSLLNWSIDSFMPPVQLQMHLTNKCNLNCIFCPTKSMYAKLSKSELSIEKWKSIVNEAISFGVKEFHLCGGGEPFFYKKSALELMKLIKKNGCYGEIITNGTLLSKENIKKIIKSEWDKVTFSINSSDEKIDNFIRGKGAFKKTISAINEFSKYKKELRKEKPLLAIHVVLCNRNYRNLKNIIKLASELDCQEVFFNSLNIWSEKCREFELDSEKTKAMEKEMKEAEKLAGQLDIDTNLSKIGNFKKFDKEKISNIYVDERKKSFANLPCFVPWYNVSIFPNGDVRPCFLYDGPFDNIEEKSLKETWEGDNFNLVRENFIQNKINEGCKNCNVYNMLDNQRIQEDIKYFSDLSNLWNKLKDHQNTIKSIKEELLKKETQIKRKNIKLNLKMDESKRAKTELKKTRLELNKAEKIMNKEKEYILSMQKELKNIYNSKGYKYILKPLEKIYLSLRKKKTK